MLCFKCRHQFHDVLKACPECGQPVPADWELLVAIYPPEDVMIKGLLESFGIPTMLRSEAIGRIHGLTFGPLAEVKVMVPRFLLEEAKSVLNSEPETES